MKYSIFDLVSMAGLLGMSLTLTFSIWVAYLGYLDGANFGVHLLFNEFGEGIFEVILFTSMTLMGTLSVFRVAYVIRRSRRSPWPGRITKEGGKDENKS